jgi:hypothetical protein
LGQSAWILSPVRLDGKEFLENYIRGPQIFYFHFLGRLDLENP